MVANDTSTGKAPNSFAHMPKEWITPIEAVALIADEHGADRGEVARAVVDAVNAKAISCAADVPANIAIDPTMQTSPMRPGAHLSGHGFDLQDIDWITGTVRIFRTPTVDDLKAGRIFFPRDVPGRMTVPVLLDRAGLLNWAASSPSIKRLGRRRFGKRSQEKRGRGGVKVSRQVTAAIQALGARLATDGTPERGDGQQAKLERWFVDVVEAAGGSISESHARTYVRAAIALQRKELGQSS